VYEPEIVTAITNSPYTQNLSIRVFNQGVNGGTVKDLIKGYSPWGHLNPNRALANTTFLQTLDEDRPNIVVLQIGINDVWQAGPGCGDRCSNVTEFVRVVREEIYAPVAARGALLVLASVSTIGETPGGVNAHDAALDAFAAAQEALATELKVPFVALRAADETYEGANNCRGLYSGVLTYDGVHPNPRGAANLANLHAGGIAAALRASGAPVVPPLPPYGGRVWLTDSSYAVQSGVAGADADCTKENGGAPAKALIVDAGGCGGAPCRRATVTPYLGDGQVDWVLAPNRTYNTRDNSSTVGFTDASGLFAWPLFKGVGPCDNQVSGFANAGWTTNADGNCDNWSPSNSGKYGVGWACGTDNCLAGGELACPALQKLMCVSDSD
jgi:lysophospholipase L1-like esterase